MSRFERDSSRHTDSTRAAREDAQPAAQQDASKPFGSNADAEQSAAHIAELVNRTAERQASQSPSFPDRPAVGAVPPNPMPARPDDYGIPTPVEPPALPGKRRPRRYRPSLVATVAVAILVIGAGIVALFMLVGANAGRTSSTPTAAPTVRSAAPAGYAVKATDTISDCARHARGRVKSAFNSQNCVKATRFLATGRVSGRPVLFVLSRIQMASAEQAAAVKQVLDGTDTGNLDDLLREGKGYPGAPEKMPSSGYASLQLDKVVAVAEAGFVDDGRSSSGDPALRAAAAQVAALVGAQS